MSCVLAGVHRLNPLFKINVLVYLHSNVLVYLLLVSTLAALFDLANAAFH